jgi:site-specific recombinase XerC
VFSKVDTLAVFMAWFLPAPRVKRQQVPRHPPRAPGPRAKVRYLRAVEAWRSARDRAIALLPLYVGTCIAEIRALDLADVRLSARKGEVHLVGRARNPGWSPSTASCPTGCR